MRSLHYILFNLFVKAGQILLGTAQPINLREQREHREEVQEKDGETEQGVGLVSHPALIEDLLSNSQAFPEQEYVVLLCQDLQGLWSLKRNYSTEEISCQ